MNQEICSCFQCERKLSWNRSIIVISYDSIGDEKMYAYCQECRAVAENKFSNIKRYRENLKQSQNNGSDWLIVSVQVLFQYPGFREKISLKFKNTVSAEAFYNVY